jgi:hypothetical protein
MLSGYAPAGEVHCNQDSSGPNGQLTELLKTTLQSFNDLQMSTDGPNCWNAALISTGILKSTRPVTKPEFWFWMNSEYCKALPASEKPRTGDIGSLFWKHWGNYHSFMRIDDNTVFSKNGPEIKDKYKVQSYESMFFDNYKEMAKTCKGSEQNLKNKGCEFEVVHHRCRPLENNFFAGVKEIKNTSDQIDGIESRLSKWMVNSESLSESEVSAAFEALGTHLTQVRAQKLEGQKEFARKALEYRIVGLLHTGLNDARYSLTQDALAAVDKAYQVQTKERSHVPKTADEIQHR